MSIHPALRYDDARAAITFRTDTLSLVSSRCTRTALSSGSYRPKVS
jgi:hypothetical protein